MKLIDQIDAVLRQFDDGLITEKEMAFKVLNKIVEWLNKEHASE